MPLEDKRGCPWTTDICPSNNRMDKCPPILGYMDIEIRYLGIAHRRIENRVRRNAGLWEIPEDISHRPAELAKLQTEFPFL